MFSKKEKEEVKEAEDEEENKEEKDKKEQEQVLEPIMEWVSVNEEDQKKYEEIMKDLEIVTTYQKFKDDQDKLEDQKMDDKLVENLKEEDIKVSKMKEMKLWDQVDTFLDTMVELREKYEKKLPKNNQGYLCDDMEIEDHLEAKHEYGFLERSEAIKKRISFFGIFSTGEKLEML